MDADTAHCLRLARAHYENFPVASRLLPATMRAPVAVIYAFARNGDDIADEGDASDAERIAQLDSYGEELRRACAGDHVANPVLRASARVIETRRLPEQLFHDLLSAFRQDVTRKRYETIDDVLDYCRRSANPVGRLMLYLANTASDGNLTDSDYVCSALQLINFLQDMSQDYNETGRIYLPQDEMTRFGVSEAHLRDANSDAAMRALFQFQVARARRMLETGKPLGRRLGGLFGLEIRTIIEGGLAVVQKLESQPDSVFTRPRLGRVERLRLLWRAL